VSADRAGARRPASSSVVGGPQRVRHTPRPAASLRPSGARAAARSEPERPLRELRIHLVNAPDVEAYWFRPDRLREQVRRAVRRPVTVTVGQDPTDVPAEMRGAHVVVGFELPARRMAELDELRWIHLVSAGVNHLLPLDWLPPGVTLTNSSGVHSELAGQYGAAALLALNFRLPVHATHQRRGHWDQVFNSPIGGKTVVLIGLGAIGGSVAREARRLGLRVLGVRRSRQPHPHADRVFGPAALSRLLPQADFVVVTAPLTPESRHLLGAKELDLLKPGAGVVNMSRAALVDYEALVRGLEAGTLAGAVIDVCDPEPLPPASPLWHTPNLMITPHVSSDPIDYVERMTRIFVDNARRLLAGRPLKNRVDPTRGY
jgi:phosphoglycerate dehydrogenase-like enzyme